MTPRPEHPRPEHPRPEYPRPQMVRDEWRCLNGTWEFELDPADSGEERGMLDRRLAGEIVVPFAPEAPLSGVGLEDFVAAVWYRREVDLPGEWGEADLALHLQAVDYETTVWVDGKEVGRHAGGSTPATFVLSRRDLGDRMTVVVRARDDAFGLQPRGKQSDRLRPYESRYPRTTGIWQTVWIEPLGTVSLGRPRLTPDVAGRTLRLDQPLRGRRRGARIVATLGDAEGEIATRATPADLDLTPSLAFAVPPDRCRLWSPEDPHCYTVTIRLLDAAGAEVDRVTSYAGLRSLGIVDGAVLLNGTPRFQRLVLDQGYWPDGGLTAPDDDALVADIVRAKQAGFDGARAHQRVAEERWLFHADRLGYLVWGEFPDWNLRRGGAGTHHAGFPISYAGEWLEVIARDYSHPSIVAWCPLNETDPPPDGSVRDLDAPTKALFLAARQADSTRPVLDVSGYHHRVVEADLWDCHDYDQDVAAFAARYRRTALDKRAPAGVESAAWPGDPQPGQAMFVSEFGGACLDGSGNHGSEQAHGYGTPVSPATLLERFGALCGALLDNPGIAGYCYTQLCDTYQEQNGLLDDRRQPKLPLEALAAAQRRQAAIELRAPAVAPAAGTGQAATASG